MGGWRTRFGPRFARRHAAVIAYGTIVVALLALQRIANALFYGAGWTYGTDNLSTVIAPWVQFDGHRYLSIAASGYAYSSASQSTIAWFPFYPLCIRAGTALGLDPNVSAVVITLLAGAGAATLWRAWLTRMGIRGTARTTAWLTLLLYPYAFFVFGIVYSDTLFLFLVLACFTLVEADRPILAGLVAALASATRPVGVALVVGAFVLHLERTGVLARPFGPQLRAQDIWRATRLRIPAVRPTSFAPLLGLAGVGSYILYLGWKFGAPFAFVENQQTFRPGSPLMNLTGVRAILDGWRAADAATILAILAFGLAALAALAVLRRRMRTRLWWALAAVIVLVGLVAARWNDFVEFPAYRSTTAAQGLISLFVIASVPAVHRRFGLGYAVHTAILVAIPTLSLGDFMGAGRYLIAAFPVAALWGERLADAPAPLRFAVLATSGTLMAVMSVAFTRGNYLS